MSDPENRRPQAASTGTYGQAPDGYRLPAATTLGPVHLQVADLERSLAFYRDVLGLSQVDEPGAASVRLATEGGNTLVQLHAQPGVRPVPRRGRLGLYHFAILLPDRPALGRFVSHLAHHRVAAGAGDHLVSEALYLTDPDGLGIEVYADRPRASWQRVGRELLMATDPVDFGGLMAAGGDQPWSGMPRGAVIGHLHLHVGDLGTASAFYSAALGFDRTVWSYPGALFFAAGGYHHHLGTNTWAGPGALRPEETEAQLLHWTIELPDPESLANAARSIASRGFEIESAEGRATARDPWGTALLLAAPAGRSTAPSS